ncbi:site-specific integrase [Flavihumibacter profundi]|uniref:site-specific integrase n=1 Tax=Flavihumibacter profundi TaxID=2716883 RepID=UPI001CC6A477|nr:site-specific integrase [Flavihumibacter profundi]MBZ5857776.1 site-specific integrase [Flavihumibacter profundi]
MAKNNFNILFWLFKAKTNKKGETPIYLRISYETSRKNISTGFAIISNRWDQQKGLVRGTKEDAVQINNYIAHTKARLMELFTEMLKEGDLNLEILIDRFFGKDTANHTLLELVEYHNNDFQARIGTDYAPSTFEKYDILRRKLEAFIALTYQKKDIRLKDLTIKFMADFDFYLKNHDGNEHNTATKYLKNLKKILGLGIRNKWLEDSPFDHFKASYKDVDRIYLTLHELTIIKKKEFRLERLTLVRDLFLFQCYTGLSYSDMAKLTFGNIAPGIDGTKWIITRRKKTDVRAAIPLLFEAEEIIDRYNNKDANSNKPLFDFYSLQKFNAYLHEIAELCEINKSLTSHVGRRTFATTIALANGIGLETISKILGHTSTKITAQYAVVSDLKISQDMQGLRDKLEEARKKGN